MSHGSTPTLCRLSFFSIAAARLQPFKLSRTLTVEIDKSLDRWNGDAPNGLAFNAPYCPVQLIHIPRQSNVRPRQALSGPML